MFTTGLALACVSAAGFYMVWRKLPRRLRRFMQKHALLTDFVACMLTYALFGGTIVALFAAAFMGVITSIMLALMNNPGTAALMERTAIRLGEAKDAVINWLGSLAEVPEEEKPRLEMVK